ncbi:MAG: M24 family metallopeptidase [Pseudomonadota bacterium]
MFVKTKNFSADELARFRDLQEQSFRILQSAALKLAGGETEQSVARQLVKDYYAAGFSSFFHLPVVLFGERTALPGNWTVKSFFPKRKALADGDSVILDASPIRDGFLVDTSYSFCFGDNDVHREMMRHLSQYRESIPKAVNKGATFRQIARDVIDNMTRHGYEPVHTKHIGEVLGHRAVKLGKLPFKPRMRGFDAYAISWFNLKDKLATSGVGRRSPLWSTLKASNHQPHDGLWLVEPHAGKAGVGAKWEEILVIEDGQARWLDDTPPHVRQWRDIASGSAYRPAV